MSIFTNLIQIPKKENIGIVNLTDEFFCVYLKTLAEVNQENVLVGVNSLFEANKLYKDLLVYTDSVSLFPMDDFLTSEAIAISPDLQMLRMQTLIDLSLKKKQIIITNLMGFLRFLPNPHDFYHAFLSYKIGNEVSSKDLISNLLKLGYHREAMVTQTGEFAVRGFVIDIFPVNFEHPIRLEFFGDEIDEIRTFQVGSQRSLEKLESISIYPCWEFIVDEEVSLEKQKQKYLPDFLEQVFSIKDYLTDPVVIYKDYSQLEVSERTLREEILTYQQTKDLEYQGSYMFYLKELSAKKETYYMNLDNLITHDDIFLLDYKIKTVSSFQEDIDAINRYLKNSLKEEKTIVICLNKTQISHLIPKLSVPYIETDENHIKTHQLNIIEKPINQGFIFGDYIFISQNELYHEKKQMKKSQSNFKYTSKIEDINKLQVGDYIVHDVHGIGIYNGIRVLTQNGVNKDYLELLYKNNDKLYIPVEKIDYLNKYNGKEGSAPAVHSLSGNEWEKTKRRVSQKIADMADQLLKLYAERESKKGFAFSKDTAMMADFECDIPFELTADQKLAIRQIKADMESIQPMDRLLCGDVGFGKTEVAFVSAFKAILDSKQVLFLCPTTILSNQHYENALKRFQHFPVQIALLNRFTSAREAKRIMSGLKDGTIDMVFGTHRLLSEDIKPNDLGLLIIDEEQRFGVAHKEKIKQYKSNVDVLTLTATPIPRTLQMSMTGIRSLSLIETPPVDRYPIQTYVIEENNQIIKDAIYKELSRGGQVFLLYNRVELIERKAEEIARLIPDAKITVAHGQMTKLQLENKMIDFINHEYDILVCTTIIETGIDIPNVNTLIILDADRFGLSQLYQIRGRVGRSNKFAYAYLMYKPFKSLTETAIKRLNVIKEFTELGSGFSIATRDLSIRGAGDILGREQAGFIDSIGIDLYLRLLNNEVARRQGKDISEEEEDTKPLINVATHIEDDYVSEEDLKIEIHKLINTIDSKKRLDQVRIELEDRFGRINEDMLIYMHEEWFEKLARSIPVKNFRQTKNSMELSFSKEVIERLDMEQLFVDACQISMMFRFKTLGEVLVIILDTIKLEEHPLYYLCQLLEKIDCYLNQK